MKCIRGPGGVLAALMAILVLMLGTTGCEAAQSATDNSQVAITALEGFDIEITQMSVAVADGSSVKKIDATTRAYTASAIAGDAAGVHNNFAVLNYTAGTFAAKMVQTPGQPNTAMIATNQVTLTTTARGALMPGDILSSVQSEHNNTKEHIDIGNRAGRLMAA